MFSRLGVSCVGRERRRRVMSDRSATAPPLSQEGDRSATAPPFTRGGPQRHSSPPFTRGGGGGGLQLRPPTSPTRQLVRLLTWVCTCLSLCGSPAHAQMSDDEILAGAAGRIQLHRQADAVVRVVDAGGHPVPDAEVRIEQTRHAFLFGSNIFQWGRLPNETLEKAYRDRFAALLNYATLPFYWPAYERQQGEPRHKFTEQVARWCASKGLRRKDTLWRGTMTSRPGCPTIPRPSAACKWTGSTTVFPGFAV